MKVLSREEMKKVAGGMAYQCCVYTETNTGFYRRCGLTVEAAEDLVLDGGADPNLYSYYECGGSLS